MKANAFEFVKQFHPSISICYVHPLHPFTARERFIVYMCTVAFNFVCRSTRRFSTNAS